MGLRRWPVVLIAGVSLLLSGGYVFIYLYRWEWNRALISGVIFLASEVAVIGWALNRKLTDVGRRIDAERAQRIGGHLSSARQQPTTAFEWLRPDPGRTHVFVPILMGAGLVLSGLAWVVEWLGRSTAARLADERLATGLSQLAPPAGGFLEDRRDPLRDLRAPVGGRR